MVNLLNCLLSLKDSGSGAGSGSAGKVLDEHKDPPVLLDMPGSVAAYL